MNCERCGEYVVTTGMGRTPRFCSTKCRVAAHRERRRIPRTLTSVDRWTRREGKRPVRVDGRAASTTDPKTWTTWRNVQHGAGDGFGIMLGDGIACYDLDHCLTGDDVSVTAAVLLASVNPIYVERSMSGDGLHVFVYADQSPGVRRDGYEFYSRERFIAVTGDTYST